MDFDDSGVYVCSTGTSTGQLILSVKPLASESPAKGVDQETFSSKDLRGIGGKRPKGVDLPAFINGIDDVKSKKGHKVRKASSTYHEHSGSSGSKPIVVTTRRPESTTETKGSLQTSEQPHVSGAPISSPGNAPRSSVPPGGQLDLAPPVESAAKDSQQSLAVNRESLRGTSVNSASASTKGKAAIREPAKSITGVRNALTQRDSMSLSKSLSPEKADAPNSVELDLKDTGTYHVPKYSSNKTTSQRPCANEGANDAMRSGAQQTYTISDFRGPFPAFSVTAANVEKAESGAPSQDVSGPSEKISDTPHNCHPQHQQAPRERPLDSRVVREDEILIGTRRMSLHKSREQVALQGQISAEGLATVERTRIASPISNPLIVQENNMSEYDFTVASKSRVSRPPLQQPPLSAEQTSSTTAMLSEELPQTAIANAGICITSNAGKLAKKANADGSFSRKTRHIASAGKDILDHVEINLSKQDLSSPKNRKKKLISEGLSRDSTGREISRPTIHDILDTQPPAGEKYALYSTPLSEPPKSPMKLDFTRGDTAAASNKVDLAKPSSSQLSASTRSTSNVTIKHTSRTTPRRAHAAIVPAGAPVQHEVEQLVPKEHLLYPVALCLMFVLILMLCFLFLPSQPSPLLRSEGRRPANRLSTDNCTSISCLRNAPYLRNLLSWRRVDPCHNFNAFVCLGWTAQFALPFRNGSTDDDYVSYLEQDIINALQKNSQNRVLTRPLYDLYEKCTDFDAFDSTDSGLLLDLLSEVSPEGFPLNASPPAGISVWKTAAKILRKSGAVALVSVGVASHPIFTAKDIASVGPPQLLTSGRGINAEEALRLYMTAILLTASELKLRRLSQPDFLAGITFASELERLAQLRLKRSAGKIEVLDSQSPLQEFLTEAFGEFQGDLSIAANEILIRSPEFVGDIVDMVARTEVRTVLNYLGLRLMIQMAPFVPSSALIKVHNTLLYGKYRTKRPSQLCVRAVETALRPLVFSRLFASPNLNASTPVLFDFARAFFDEFRSEINASTFFDSRSKAAIGRILSRTTIEVIGPSWTQNAALILRYVEGLPEITANDSAHQVYLQYYPRTFVYILERGARMRWSGSAFSTDCWYESHPRTVYVPLLAFNGTQALDGGGVDAMQLSRLGPRLGRCLFDMLLDAADSAENDERWLTDGTRQTLLRAEACFMKRQDYVRFGRLRDVLALGATYRLFAKVVGADAELAVPNHERGAFTAAQAFYASLMLQNCDKGGRPTRAKKKMPRSADGRCPIAEKFSVSTASCLPKTSEVLPSHERSIDAPSMRELSGSSPESPQESASIRDADSVRHPALSDGSSPTPTKRLEQQRAPQCSSSTKTCTVRKKAAVAQGSRLGSSGSAVSNGEVHLAQKSSKPFHPASSTENLTSPTPDGSSSTIKNSDIKGDSTTIKTPASDNRAREQNSRSPSQLAEVPRLQFALKKVASQRLGENSYHPLCVSNRLYRAEDSGPSVSEDLCWRGGDGRTHRDEARLFNAACPSAAPLGHKMLQRAAVDFFGPTSATSPDDPPAQSPSSAFGEKFKNGGVTSRYNSATSPIASEETVLQNGRPIRAVPRAKYLSNERRFGGCKTGSPGSQRAKVKSANIEERERKLRRTLGGTFCVESNEVVEPGHSIYIRDTWKHFDRERQPDPAPRFAPEEHSADFIVRTDGDQVLFKECLLYPLAFCLLFGVVIVCALLLLPTETSGHLSARVPASDTCRSSSCFQTARDLKDLLSWKIADPCDDFYAFVCRRWQSHHVAAAPKDHSVSFDDDYEAYLENKMHAIIQDESLKSDALLPVRQLHMKCVDVKGSEEEGLKALQWLMSELSLEGFPFAPPMRGSMSIWEAAAKVLRKTGASALIEVGVASSPSQPDGRDVVSVGPPEMVTASEGIGINDAISLYTEAVSSSIRVFKKERLASDSSLSIVKFVADLETIGNVKLRRQNSPKIDVLKSPSSLLQFLAELFRGVNGSLFAGEGSEVMVLSPIVMNKIFDLVRGTEAHTVMNYLAVRVLIGTSPFLPQVGLTDFYSTLTYARRQTNVPRRHLCIRAVEKALFPLVYASLMANVELHASITSVRDRTRDFMEVFLNVIEASPLFDMESMTAIRGLISAVKIRVFGPEWVNNDTLIQRYVQGLPLVPANQSGLQLYANNYEYTFLAPHALSSSSRWTRSVFSADCWHELYPATLNIPLLMFNITRALYKDLGGLHHIPRAGPRLGRCIFDLIVHAAFETQSGAANWLTENTEQRMRNVETCVYSAGGELSLRFPRVRDILAARAAYAYFRNESWSETTKLRLSDDHVLTGQQLFFIYFMLQACEYGATVQEDSKGGRDWEVALSNSDDFTDAFQCAPGSHMNPLKKCAL
ncbi:hypothetical protein V5799_014407 [Amblyomma americanum]|uniref:Peptidase M13 N-terminal domain-containing protein n=1 Tax=Amblyomma americanum TaxID=6943 RepID=A0AAQ4E353_AMBAM